MFDHMGQQIMLDAGAIHLGDASGKTDEGLSRLVDGQSKVSSTGWIHFITFNFNSFDLDNQRKTYVDDRCFSHST